MNKSFIDKLAFIDLRNGKVLVTMSKGKDTWYIPGGKREAGETDANALIREMEEETTVKLVEQSLKKYGVFAAQAHGKPEGTMVRMTCYTGQFEGELSPSNEIALIDYVGYEVYEALGPVDKLIFDDLKARGLIR
jgi:8-oxo-dGTP diphosphatase